ncbi:MAG: HAMP domain-containing protein [Clostridiales bacterium]|nr:HAMP domain-containing protein [Clostridiales bacterium]
MKKLTLQWRITILTALVLAVCSVVLTIASIINADNSFAAVMEPAHMTEIPEVIPENEREENAAEMPIAGTPAQMATGEFRSNSIVFCVLIIILGTTAVYLAVGSALSPLRKLSAEVENIDEQSLSERLPETTMNDEVGKLTHGFNEMLNRLDHAFLRQKRFSANAAHELKTPLATLKTGVQVLEADSAATIEDYRDNAQKTLLSVNRMSNIVDDLLLLASVGEKSIDEKEEIMLEPLFEAIADELSFLLEEKKITCSVQCGELSVAGNPEFFYRIYFNLIENACKYGKQGGSIRVNAFREDDSTYITVKDDGPGIPKEHLPFIFDAFYRVDKSRSREMGGSGLGLSLVKTMVEASRGTVTVESDGKNGTCFKVKFPDENLRLTKI